MTIETPVYNGKGRAEAAAKPRMIYAIIPSVIVLLIAVFWVVLVFWSMSERRRQVENTEANLRQRTVAVAVAEQTLRLFKLTETSFLTMENWLQGHSDPYPGENPEFTRMVDRLRHISGGIIDFRLVDPDGNLFQIPTLTREPAGNVSTRENVRVQRDPRTRGFFISDPVVSPVGEKWAVPITYPVLRQDDRLHIIAGVIDLASITDIFESQRLKPNGSITLIKTSGVTLFRAPMIEGAIGRSIAASKDFSEHFTPMDRGTYHIAGAFDAVERIVSFEKLPEYGVIVATTATMDDALAHWRRETATIGVASAIATLILTFLVFRLLRSARQADMALRQHGREIAAILDTSPVGVLFVDGRGVIIRANARLAEMLACPMERLVGSAYTDFIDHAAREEVARKIEAHFLGEMTEVSQRREYIRDDGSRFWGEQSGRRMVDDQGNPMGLVGVITDISDRMAFERRLEAKGVELESLNQELKASNSELETFAYVASHDLREPLRMISSYMGLLDRRYGQLLDKDGREFLAFAKDGALRMDQLVRGLLDFARIERDGAQFTATPLAEAIQTAVDGLEVLIAEAGATVRIAPDFPNVMVMGETSQLVRLFQNLIGNGLKYRVPGRGPIVEISGEAKGGLWEIAISDNGIGIDAEHFERIFGLFKRLHTREAYDGTGIGLAICKKIVERHHGRIWVESTPGVGSTFFVTLWDASRIEPDSPAAQSGPIER